MSPDQRDASLQEWLERESISESMIPIIGSMYRRKNIVLSLYGRPIINRSVIDVIKAHRFVRHVATEELSVHDSFPVLEALSKLDIKNCHIDLGKLSVKFRDQGQGKDVDSFIRQELEGLLAQDASGADVSRDVVLYGFGRIGRLLARILTEKASSGALRLRAIVVRKGKGNDLLKRSSLLLRDSIHGTFKGSIQTDEENNLLILNGNPVQIIYSNAPESVDYEAHGIREALVIDNTGIWRDEEGLSLHLKAKGVARVLLTAPGKGDLKNIVYGLNQSIVSQQDQIVTAASCTTNAISPVLKVISERYGLVSGHVETVHSYTNDQNLIDNYHPKDRRGRAAALNMVITETGAAKAVTRVLPEMAGKLTGNAIRVPTPNVSMAILSLTLEKEVAKEEVNEFLRQTSLEGPLQRQIEFVDSPEVVSSDFVGNRHAAIVDGQATIVSGNRVNLYVWYDNEYGYSRQVVRLAQHMVGVHYPTYPPRQ